MLHVGRCAHAQEEVYDSAAREAVTSAINGFNACVLCYGQTGSGKTHTMFGPPGIYDMPMQSEWSRSRCGPNP